MKNNKRIISLLCALLMMSTASIQALSVGALLKAPLYPAKLWYRGAKRIAKFCGNNWEDIMVLSLLAASAAIWKKNYDIQYGRPSQSSLIDDVVRRVRSYTQGLRRYVPRVLTRVYSRESVYENVIVRVDISKLSGYYWFEVRVNGQYAFFEVGAYSITEDQQRLIVDRLASEAASIIAVQDERETPARVSLQQFFNQVGSTIVTECLVPIDIPIAHHSAAGIEAWRDRVVSAVVEDSSEEVASCSICLEPVISDIKITDCSHTFHRACFSRIIPGLRHTQSHAPYQCPDTDLTPQAERCYTTVTRCPNCNSPVDA